MVSDSQMKPERLEQIRRRYREGSPHSGDVQIDVHDLVNELARLRRKAAALDVMEKWGLSVEMIHGWYPYQTTRCDLHDGGFYSQAEDDAHYDTPCEAIEAAAAWLEKQEQADE